MIKLKDLQNRVYRGKSCIKFEYDIIIEEKHMFARYTRDLANPTTWNMQIVFDRTKDKDSEIYNFGYVMPRDGLPLEIIAAVGFKYFQLYLKEEIQTKSNLEFEIGNILQGMV